MKKYIAIFFIIPNLILVFVLYFLLKQGILDISTVFYQSIRPSFFTAFLTAGSFMLSLLATVLFTFSSKFFDDKLYIDNYVTMKKDFPKIENLYAPLIRLGKVFIVCVGSCIITSISQTTIGFINSNISLAICLSLACVSFFLILFLLFHFAINLMNWFSLLEDKGSKL